MEKILVVRELKWEGRRLMQKLLIQRDGQDVEEWREVSRNAPSEVPGHRDRRYGAPPEFWQNLDWKKTNRQLAEELHYSLPTISVRRAQFGFRRYKYQQYDWSNVDWTKSNYVIATETGQKIQTVVSARYAHGKPPHVREHYNPRRKVSPEQIESVDWEWYTDVEISREIGISRERVRQLRIDLKKPDCRVKWKGRYGVESYRWLEKNREQITGMHAHEIVRMMPGNVQLPTKARILKLSGIQCVRGKVWKYSEFGDKPLNWLIPNKWLSMVWGIPPLRVAQNRMHLNAGPAKWHGGGFSNYATKQDFKDLLDAEIQIARENGVDVNVEAIKAELEFQLSRKSKNSIKTEQNEPKNENQVT